MAARLKLPIARVLTQEDEPTIDDIFGKADTRLLLVDLTLLRMTKSYAQLRKQAASWSDADVENYLLSMIAQGPT